MGFISFVGRVFFSAIFILAAWQKMNDFGSDGGITLQTMNPKIALFKEHVAKAFNTTLPEFDNKYFLMAAIALEGAGGILFTIGSSLGAYALLIFIAAVTPIMHDFYNYDPASHEFTQEFIQFLKNLSLFGALLFYLGMRSSAAKLAARKRKTALKTKTS